METGYQYTLSQFKNGKVSSDRLSQEIQASSIIVGLKRIDTFGTAVDIVFKSELSTEEVTILDGIVANHSGLPLVDNTIQQIKIAVEQPKYIEEGNPTQELFCAESLVVDISSGDTLKIVDFTWPFNIALKSGTLFVTEDMIGDEMTVKIAPDTIIGVITADINAGDTSAQVSPTVIQNIKYGQYAGIVEKQTELGRVVSVGSDYLEFDRQFDISAGAGSYIGMCAKIIPYLYFSKEGFVEIGKTVNTANRIPTNTKVRLEYKNNNGLAKKTSFFVEYLY